LLGLVRRFFAESLFKNSAFLIVNLGVGALSGFGGLALLTHVFSKADVGLSATAVSAAGLIETITLLGVTYSVPRYLPTAKNRTAMINTLLTGVISLTLLASGIFLALPYSRKFFVLGGWLFALVFVVAMCVQVGTTLLSSVLVADRAADKAVTLGMVPALITVVAPPALSFLGSLGAFVARVVPESFSFLLYGTLLVRRGHRFRPTLDNSVVRELGRFSIGMYFAGIIGGLPQMLLPLIALSRVGADQSAYWSIATSISATLYSLPSMVTSALLPEVSLRPAERSQLLRRSALLIVGVVTPALVVAFFAAPIILPFFGKSYVSGTLPVLRWLVGAGFITMLNAISGAILFVAKKSRQMTVVNAVNAVIVIGLVAVWATNATDIAIAWTVGDAANTVLFGALAFLAVREVGGRLDRLGGDQVSGIGVVPEQLPVGSQQTGLDLLVALAQQQRGVGIYNMYKPYSPALTRPQGLYSLAALQAAEQRLLSRTSPLRGSQAPAEAGDTHQALDVLFDMAETSRGSEAPAGVAETHQALDLLFNMAEQQRVGEGTKPDEQYPPDAAVEPPSYGSPPDGYPYGPPSGSDPYGPPSGGHPYGG
jgi:O-antigen/teichoic acid export membrane protein